MMNFYKLWIITFRQGPNFCQKLYEIHVRRKVPEIWSNLSTYIIIKVVRDSEFHRTGDCCNVGKNCSLIGVKCVFFYILWD